MPDIRASLLSFAHTNENALKPRYLIIEGNYAYVVNQGSYGNRVETQSSIDVFEITDLEVIARVGSARLGIGRGCRGVAVKYPYVYASEVGLNYGGLWIIDVSDPRNPRPVREDLSHPYFAHAIVREGEYLIAPGTANATLRVLSLANPALPSVVSEVSLAAISPRLSKPFFPIVTGGYLYLSHMLDYGIVSIFDARGMASNGRPTFLTSIETGIYTRYMAYWNGHLFLCYGGTGTASDNQIAIVDVRNPQSPRCWTRDVDRKVGNGCLVVNGCLLTASEGAMLLCDVRDPTQLVELGIVHIDMDPYCYDDDVRNVFLGLFPGSGALGPEGPNDGRFGSRCGAIRVEAFAQQTDAADRAGISAFRGVSSGKGDIVDM